MKYWWQEQPLVISALQAPVKRGSKAAFDEYVSKSSYNVEQLLHLFFPYGDGDMTFYDEEKHGALLDDYLEHTKASGIKRFIYTNTHCLSLAKAAENSDYWQLGKDGNPLYGYGIYKVACINPKGAFHKEIIKNIKGICTHDVGGIFFDGPLMRDTGCYCKTCQADFMEKFGHSIFDATDIERHKFRVDTVTEHIKIASETIKSINPNIALYINNSALRADITGSNTRELYDYVDLLGSEAGFYIPSCSCESLWKNSAFLKHLECIIGDPLKEKKPMVNFVAANDSAISEQDKTSAETALTYAQTLANGGNIWYGFHYDVFDAMNTNTAKKALEYNKYILANKDLYKTSKSCARVALMWSDATANHYASSVEFSDFTEQRESGFRFRGDHRLALFSFVDMLIRNHIQFDIVDEVAIERDVLKNYDSLILPSVACLSDETAEKIKAFVKNGGNLLGNFDVGMYDEYGAFYGKSKLADVFGLVGEPKIHDVSVWSPSVMYTASEHPILKHLDSSTFISTYIDSIWEFTKDTKPLCITHPAKESVYCDPPTERYPCFTEHAYGNGKAYFLSGNFGESFTERHPLEYSQIIKGFCEFTSKPVTQTCGNGLYEVTLRKQEDKFLLHIVNLTGTMVRPLDNIVPLSNLSFTLNLDGFGIAKENYNISAARGGKIENVAQNGNNVSFTLDTLGDYEVIVLE